MPASGFLLASTTSKPRATASSSRRPGLLARDVDDHGPRHRVARPSPPAPRRPTPWCRRASASKPPVDPCLSARLEQPRAATARARRRRNRIDRASRRCRTPLAVGARRSGRPARGQSGQSPAAQRPRAASDAAAPAADLRQLEGGVDRPLRRQNGASLSGDHEGDVQLRRTLGDGHDVDPGAPDSAPEHPRRDAGSGPPCRYRPPPACQPSPPTLPRRRRSPALRAISSRKTSVSRCCDALRPRTRAR